MTNETPGLRLPEHKLLFPQGRHILARHGVTVTHHIGRARSSVENVFFPHRLVPPSGTNAVNFQHRCVGLQDITLNFINYGTDLEVLVKDLNREKYVIVIPLEGEAEVQHGNQSFGLLPGTYMVIDPMSRFDCYLSPDHCHLAIGIPRWRLDATLERQGLGSSRALDLPFGSVQIDAGDRALFGMLAYICREIDEPGSVLENSVVAASMEDTFLLLFAQRFMDRTMSVYTAPETSATVPYYVRRAERFMLANLTENLNITELAEAAGVPVRTLYYGFHQARGQPPLAWLKTQRLRQARQDILHDHDMSLTVTELANRYCASSIGRFAAAYRAAFGELPSETRRRLKQ